MLKRFFLLALILSWTVPGGLGHGSAVAEGKPVFAVGPGAEGGGCVGEISTPICAVDTWLSCFARVDAKLCARVAPHVKVLFGSDWVPVFERYQIAEILTITPERINPRLAKFQVKPGDVEVRLRQHRCQDATGNCNLDNTVKSAYFLSHREGGWILRAWTDENAGDTGCRLLYETEPYYRWCHIMIYEPTQPWVHDWSVGSKME